MPNLYMGINTGMQVAGALFTGGVLALAYIFWEDVRAWGKSLFTIPQPPRFWRDLSKE